MIALLVMILRPDKDGEGTDGADTTGASWRITADAPVERVTGWRGLAWCLRTMSPR